MMTSKKENMSIQMKMNTRLYQISVVTQTFIQKQEESQMTKLTYPLKNWKKKNKQNPKSAEGRR